METKKFEIYCNCNLTNLLIKSGFNWQDYFVAHSIDENFHWEIPLHIAQKWLRENKDFDINILTDFDSVKRFYYVRYVEKDGHYKTYYITKNQSYVYFNTYEEAQEAGIKKALEIILNENEI